MYALHESIVIVLHFEATVSVWVQSLAKYLCYDWKCREIKDQGLLH